MTGSFHRTVQLPRLLPTAYGEEVCELSIFFLIDDSITPFFFTAVCIWCVGPSKACSFQGVRMSYSVPRALYLLSRCFYLFACAFPSNVAGTRVLSSVRGAREGRPDARSHVLLARLTWGEGGTTVLLVCSRVLRKKRLFRTGYAFRRVGDMAW